MQKEGSHRGRAIKEFLSAYSLLGGDAHVELNGSREVLIEGSSGVLYYSDTLIRVGLGRKTLLVVGCDMQIKAMFGRTLSIVGNIKSVEFC